MGLPAQLIGDGPPDDGALPGTYKVTIESHGEGPGAKVPARYTKPETSGLTCRVMASRNTIDFSVRD